MADELELELDYEEDYEDVERVVDHGPESGNSPAARDAELKPDDRNEDNEISSEEEEREYYRRGEGPRDEDDRRRGRFQEDKDWVGLSVMPFAS